MRAMASRVLKVWPVASRTNAPIRTTVSSVSDATCVLICWIDAPVM